MANKKQRPVAQVVDAQMLNVVPIVREMVTTEETYLNQLETFDKNIADINVLIASDKNISQQAKDDCRMFHGLIGLLITQHKEMLQKLKGLENAYNTIDTAAMNTSLNEVKNIFVKLSPLYEKYSALYASLFVRNALNDMDPKISRALDQFFKNNKPSTYASYTILPIQRLPRYELFFKDMYKNLPATQASIKNTVARVITSITGVNKKFDESPRLHYKKELAGVFAKIYDGKKSTPEKTNLIADVQKTLLAFDAGENAVTKQIMRDFKLNDYELDEPSAKTLLKILVGLERRLIDDKNIEKFEKNDVNFLLLEGGGLKGLSALINSITEPKAKKRIARYRRKYDKIGALVKPQFGAQSDLYQERKGKGVNPLDQAPGEPKPSEVIPESATTEQTAVWVQTRPNLSPREREQRHGQFVEVHNAPEAIEKDFNDRLVQAVVDRRNKSNASGKLTADWQKNLQGEEHAKDFFVKLPQNVKDTLNNFSSFNSKRTKEQKSHYHNVNNRVADFAIYLQQNKGNENIMDYQAFCDVYQKILDKTNEIIAQHNSDKGENIRPTRRIIMKPEIFNKMLDDVNSASATVRHRSGSK